MHTDSCIPAYINMCLVNTTYMYVCSHTYVNAYIHADPHMADTDIQSYKHSILSAYTHTYISIHTHFCIFSHIHTYLHTTYMHSQLHVCMHTYIHADSYIANTDSDTENYACLPTNIHTCIHIYMHTIYMHYALVHTCIHICLPTKIPNHRI